MIDVQIAFASQQAVVVLIGIAFLAAQCALLWRGSAAMRESAASLPAQSTRRARVTVIAAVAGTGLASFALPSLVPPLVALTAPAVAASTAFVYIAVFPRSTSLFRGQVRTAALTAARPSWWSGVRWPDVITPIAAVLLCTFACATVSAPTWAWSETVGLFHPGGNLVRYAPFPGRALTQPLLLVVAGQVLVGQVAVARATRPPHIRGASAAVAAADAMLLGSFLRSLSVFSVAVIVAHLMTIAGTGLQAASVVSTETTGALVELVQPSHTVGLLLLGGGILGWAVSVAGMLRCAAIALRPASLTVPVPQ